MALPVDFMGRVVAWPGEDTPGYVNVHWLSPKGPGMRGRPFKTLQKFMDFVQRAANRPGVYKDVFFCLSVQKDHGKEFHGEYVAHRHAEKALSLKAIWLDVDVKPERGYPTLAAAISAINAFVKLAGLPPPSALVLTGGGVHVYWISDRPLTPEEWRPYAEGLKAEALRHYLKCDAAVTADAARVLRVPGTYNNKEDKPRAVKLAHLGDSYDFAGPAFAALATKAPPAPVKAVTATVPAPAPALQLPPEFASGPCAALAHLDAEDDNLAEGLRRQDLDLPLDKAEIFRGCQHFQETARTKGAHQSQGLWHLNALACTWLEDGRKIYHLLSKGYPTYTPDETDKMFDRKAKERVERKLGWPSCSTLEGEGAKCQGCPFKGKIRSPLNLAERIASPPLVPALPPPPEELELPDNYTLNADGIICEIVEKEDRHGNSKTEYVALFMSRLRNFRAQAEDRKLLFETSLDGSRWGNAEVSEAVDLINETTIIKALRAFGVKPNTRISPKGIITFVTSFMAKLDQARERQTSVALGWLRKEEDSKDEKDLPVGFAYGGRITMADGTERGAGYADKQIEKFYKPRGTDKPWWQLLHLITVRHHPALECIIASSFAAPLAYATGHYNAVICAYSGLGGAHKTTSMALGAAVWGNPKLTKETPGSTMKGVIHKMAAIKNLPVFWDEINDKPKMKAVVDILKSTEGTGGSKLTSGREFHVYDEWQTLMQVAANLSMVDEIIAENGGTDAKLHRVFEYEVEKRADTQKFYDMDSMRDSLDRNYGHVGVMYAKLLGNNVARIHKQMKEVQAKFATEVSVRSEERFRCAAAASIYLGAVLGNELGCNFNTEEMWVFLKDEFLKQRNKIQTSYVVSGTNMNSANWLSQFMKTFNDNALWVQALPARKPGYPEAIVYVAGPNQLRPRPVHIRLSISSRIIDISRIKFFEWLAAKEAVPASVLLGLVRHYGATEPGRFNLAAGAGVLGGGREPVIRIPVPPDSPFLSDLLAHTPPDQMPTAQPVSATVISIDRNKP